MLLIFAEFLIFSTIEETIYERTSERYMVTVSKTLRQRVGEESEHYDISMKDDVQNALAFFVNRKIYPATYESGKEFDSVQVLKQSTERIMRSFVNLEQNILLKMAREIVRGDYSRKHKSTC